jgi:undecaprenyl-diphosphatase
LGSSYIEKEVRQNTKFKLIVGFLTVLALIVSLYARFTPRFPADLYLTHRLQSFDSHFLFSLMQWVSFIFGGWSSMLVVIAISVLVWWRIGRLEAIVIPVGGLVTLVNRALKLAVNRPRPSADLVHVLSEGRDGSFPSGHAFFAIVILGLLAYLIFTNSKNQTLGTVVLVVLIVLILLIGTSRVYLGVHWSSDVLGGYLTGGVFLAMLIWFHRARKSRYSTYYNLKK